MRARRQQGLEPWGPLHGQSVVVVPSQCLQVRMVNKELGFMKQLENQLNSRGMHEVALGCGFYKLMLKDCQSALIPPTSVANSNNPLWLLEYCQQEPEIAKRATCVLVRGRAALGTSFQPLDSGYVNVRLGHGVDGTTKMVGLHRLLCHVKHGPPSDSSMEACHHCGNARCGNPNHLYWGTKEQNARDSTRVVRAIRQGPRDRTGHVKGVNNPGEPRDSLRTEARRLFSNARRVSEQQLDDLAKSKCAPCGHVHATGGEGSKAKRTRAVTEKEDGELTKKAKRRSYDTAVRYS
jgi:hypothetical protein